MFNVKCLNPIATCGLDLLDDKYQLVDEYADAQGVLVRSASMHELELGENLQAIARAGAGVNNIPLDECAKKGIVVFNTPGANANGVKELVVAGLLLAARDINGGINWVKENAADENIAKTVEKAKKAFAGHEIKGKKLGVIGLGAIGVEVANTAAALGMKVYGYDPYISVLGAWHLSYHVVPVKDLKELASECDYITIHVPSMESTKGMLNKEVFDNMKDGSVILNFSRDALVNDADMEAALESGKIAKYVTDFPNTKTANMKNVIAIPHLGASTAESEDNCAVMAVEEMMDYLENGNITNSVNYPACDMGVAKAAARICVFNKNVPNIIAQLTNALSSVGINIASMANKSKGDYAYTLIDSDDKVTDEVIEKIKAIPEVFKVRVIQ
ncbi:D-3-phosphoglycerate dehydrogenase [Lachnospiraceae bacterium TWA4]|nr:D-3-phosphoglycerate dehydrogenase [Lachnospiraceae bacterium TWA4]